MKKKQLRVQLFAHSVNVADSLILAAARHNSGIAPVTLKSLQSLGYGYYETFPQLKDVEGLTIEMVGESMLCIDAKIQGVWVQVAIIEEVEVFEIPVPSEEENESSNSFY